jgi:hypothetical protein
MGAKARSGWMVVAACCCAALGACAGSSDELAHEPAKRTPAPAPRVVLTADEREVWAPAPPDRAAVPVLLVKREQVSLPPRPLLLTFDGARLDTWTGSDGILRELGLNAVLFVESDAWRAGPPNI